MSKFYARMLALLALIDKEPAMHTRKDLADRYGVSISRISGTLKAASTEFDVEVVTVGFGKDKRYKLVDWGGFKGSWVQETYERHQSLAEK